MQVDNENINGCLREVNNKYRIVITYYSEGKRKQKTYSTDLETTKSNRKKAERLLFDKINEFKNDSVLTGADEDSSMISGNMLFNNWVDNWLSYKYGRIRDISYNYYLNFAENHIKPFFIGKRLNEINPVIIDRFLYYLSEKCTDASIKRYKSLLSAIMERAVKFDLLEKNYVRYADVYKSKIETSEKNVLNAEEVSYILNELKDSEIYPIIVMICFYGLRRGECLGLTWDNIDFDNELIYIRNTVTISNNKAYFQERCKTKSSERTLKMSPDIKDLLYKVKQDQLRNVNEYRINKNIYNLVFTDEYGRMYNPINVSQRFRYFINKHDMKRIRLHDLRHSTATILFDSGADVPTVQYLLGHKSAQTTLNIYIHHTDNDNSKAVNKLTNIIKFNQ